MAYDPKLDPNNSEYDPRLDPNSDCYEEDRANEYHEQNPDASSAKAEGEEQQKKGKDAPHLPGSTAKTSDTLRKAEKGEGAGGKSPLIFDPNAPAVDSVARQNNMRVDGEVDEKRTPQMQLMSQIGGGAEGVWQEYASTAIRSLYPYLTEGVDYVWGRKEEGQPPEMIYWNDKRYSAPDMGEIEKAATKLMDRDPYKVGAYQPKPSLHTGSELAPGDVPRGGRAQDELLPRDVAQSEVNPKTDDKYPTQPYQPAE